LAADVTTVAEGSGDLRIDHKPGGEGFRVYGEVPLSPRSVVRGIGVEDPAHVAALRLKRLLEARGVAVKGEARARRRPPALSDEPPSAELSADLMNAGAENGGGEPSSNGTPASPAASPPAPAPPVAHPYVLDYVPGREIGRLQAPPLAEAVHITLLESRNLYAELLLRRLGMVEGDGSRASGLALLDRMFAEAGVPRTSYDLVDGSGLSIYDRISPRAMTQFLVYAARQPWWPAWRDMLPSGGEDGTLARRFQGGPLAGRIHAKTGTLTGVTALSGYLTTDKGETLAFAAFANDRPYGAANWEAVEAMDKALEEVAKGR
jgi:D-alanyl-D-alanine carboxypeptidase/D-alanyl-D-alanine-endopeptidase (penicillin-binding protein 4)